jgi:hypothetical protein
MAVVDKLGGNWIIGVLSASMHEAEAWVGVDCRSILLWMGRTTDASDGERGDRAAAAGGEAGI